MRQSKTDKRISVRLDPEASRLLQEVKDKGYTTSQFINSLIKGSAVIDIGQYRKLIPPLSNLQSLIEREENTQRKESMRKEVNQLWRSLKSFQENT